jgi:small subunit ribosomal protein S4
MKLYLKGSRCDSPKCAVSRRKAGNSVVAPGMHGYRRGKSSEYGVRLREKQKVKRFYGVLERQFRRYFELASRSPENTGEQLLSIMERRLDNVVHRLGFAQSRAAARQIVNHGHILLNGRVCNIPSLLLKKGDVVKVKERAHSQKLVKERQQDHPQPIPDFLVMINAEALEAQMTRLPTRGDVDPRLAQADQPLQEQLIIEFCGR